MEFKHRQEEKKLEKSAALHLGDYRPSRTDTVKGSVEESVDSHKPLQEWHWEYTMKAVFKAVHHSRAHLYDQNKCQWAFICHHISTAKV